MSAEEARRNRPFRWVFYGIYLFFAAGLAILTAKGVITAIYFPDEEPPAASATEATEKETDAADETPPTTSATEATEKETDAGGETPPPTTP